MRAFFIFMGFIIVLLGASWFGWWALINPPLVADLKLGDIFTLWRKFNESFALSGGVGAVILLVMGVSSKKDKGGKNE